MKRPPTPLTLAALLFVSGAASGQHIGVPDRVLAFRPNGVSGVQQPWETGAAAAYHRLRKLTTTGSVLHVVAHPDDEHVGMLTVLSRGQGVRTALLTLNRGEGGANAAGAELFDALGVVRAEELRISGSYYGLDDQYFTTAADYGYSKTLDEARRSWDMDRVLGDMVRVIRLNRPLVVVSRFHGTPRDGHGHHHAAGVLTPLAVEAAADPSRFPDQITHEGLKAWRVHRVVRGGVREGEPAQVFVDAATYDPIIGTTYERFGRIGVSLQRSQTAGRLRAGFGPAVYRYEVIAGAPTDSTGDLLAGLPVTHTALVNAGYDVAPGVDVAESLARLDQLADHALASFSFVDADNRAVVDALLEYERTVNGLLVSDIQAGSDGAFLLRIKQRQVRDALIAVLGLSAAATAAEDVVHPSERVAISLRIGNPHGRLVSVDSVSVRRGGTWSVRPGTLPPSRRDLALDAELVIGSAATSAPYIRRGSIAENHYHVSDSSALHLTTAPPPVTLHVHVRVDGLPLAVPVDVRAAVPDLPFGFRYPLVMVTPAVRVQMDSSLVLLAGETNRVDVGVHVANDTDDTVQVRLRLLPSTGWEAEEAGQPIAVAPGETVRRNLPVAAVGRPVSGDIRAVAEAGGEVFTNTVVVVDRRDLERRLLVEEAVTRVQPVDVAVDPGVTSVGYVVGAGDDVPAAIQRLGVEVETLGTDALATDNLDHFDAIVVGTRAYAVRPDLIAHNERLLAYAHAGGNLIVLYQTQEFVPGRMAPYPAALPRGAQEVSEEDAPVSILAPDHVVLTSPNRIGSDDFRGWIEQRGSKFFTEWDDAYRPLIETHDTGQAEQRGVWLHARVGAGHYTYVALALHRQVPYGIPGAYRILANLLSLGARAR